ncbi:MAG TPA: hypothetical protein VGI81_25865 [Tepidisphaeraceae bacterium]
MEQDPLHLRGEAAHAAIWETILFSRVLRSDSEQSAVRRRRLAALDLLCPSDRQYMELRLRLDEPPR